MDNYQKLEQIVNKTGCSYEDAKAALEGCGWDMIDAVVSLERDGKISRESVEQTAPKEEDAVEIVTEVAVEKTVSSQQSSYSYDEAADDKDSSAKSGKDAPKRRFKLWNRVKRMMINNRMVVLRSSGEQIIDLPIIVPVIALLAFFWAALVIALIAMVFGCRFHFEGEDLGKTNINNTMDKATDYAEKVRNDLTGKRE